MGLTTVRDVMHSGLITCAPNTMLADVAALLRKHRIHALVVTDRDKGPVGVVSDTDLLAGEWLGTNAENVAVLRRMTAAELMSKPLATIAASSSVAEAASEIRRLHVARLLAATPNLAPGLRPDLVAQARDAPAEAATAAGRLDSALLPSFLPLTMITPYLAQAGGVAQAGSMPLRRWWRLWRANLSGRLV